MSAERDDFDNKLQRARSEGIMYLQLTLKERRLRVCVAELEDLSILKASNVRAKRRTGKWKKLLNKFSKSVLSIQLGFICWKQISMRWETGCFYYKVAPTSLVYGSLGKVINVILWNVRLPVPGCAVER